MRNSYILRYLKYSSLIFIQHKHKTRLSSWFCFSLKLKLYYRLKLVLYRPMGSSYIHYAESSMKNGFGLKYLHRFFNIPFLQLQVSSCSHWDVAVVHSRAHRRAGDVRATCLTSEHVCIVQSKARGSNRASGFSP